jgi:exopolysaccharide biosynthesis polyprenyl glycosylphosphotransferase
MKKSELFFSAIQVPVDFLMLVLGLVGAFAIRNFPETLVVYFGLQLKAINYVDFPFKQEYFNIALLAIPFFLVIYALEGLYDIRTTRKFWQEMLKIFTATSVGFVILIIAIFLKQAWFASRFVILAGWVLSSFSVVAGRYLIRKIQQWLLVHRGIGVHKLLLIGIDGKINELRKVIKNDPKLGYKIIGQLETGSVTQVKKMKEEKGIDEILVCDSTLTDAEQEKLIDYCSIHNIKFQYIPNTLQTSRIEMRMLDGEPVIEVKNTPLDGWGRILKRIFDIICSIILIILTGPLMLIIALLIRLGGKGPIIFKNERIGSDGKKFFVYKFRYMKWEYCTSKDNPDWEKALAFEKELIATQSVRRGPLYKIKDDPRRSWIGKIIERFSFDEFPQFFNVLKGEMSLVGPRPHQEREVEKYSEYHRRLLTIKPGITGMAQISGRSDLDFEDEYLLDVYYIENWSLWLDILICFKTAAVLLKRRKTHV